MTRQEAEKLIGKDYRHKGIVWKVLGVDCQPVRYMKQGVYLILTRPGEKTFVKVD